MTSELATEPLDIADRRRAVGELETNLLVLAGAGTGKTTLLVDRLALLIVGKGIPVERVVALTFTKKAAEEMRVRLEEILRKVIAVSESTEESLPKSSLLGPLLDEKFGAERHQWKSRAEKALGDIPKAQIGTIHSFAGYLLRLYPLQSKVDPRFLEDEGSLTDQALEEAWTPWILAQFAETNQRTELWREVLRDVSLEKLKELCRALLSPRVDPALRSFSQGGSELKLLAASARQELESFLARHPLKDPSNKFGVLVASTLAVFQAVESEKRVDDPSVEDRLREAVEQSAGVSALWKKQPGLEEAFKKLHQLAKALARVDEKTLNKILNLVRPLVETVRSDLGRRGCVSFDGLLVLARNLVRDHPLVRQTLKKQFDTFLIDEFQDTDPLQGEILFYLAEDPERESSSWETVKIGEGRLFVVGDPKQSIYSFRGADMAAFAAFAERLLKFGEQAELSHNFRSQKSILDFVNTLTPLLMKPEHGLQPAYAELQSSKENASSAMCVLRVHLSEVESTGERLSADQLRQAEGFAIAEWIKKSGRPFGDFTLLFRSTSVFRFYLDAFHQFGIPYLAEGEKYFYHTPETVEFMALLSALCDPNDRIALVGVLRSPVGSLTDRDIFDLHKNDSLGYLQPPRILKERLTGFFDTLRNLHRDSGKMPLSAFLEKVLRDTRFLWLVSRSLQGDQALANVQKILRLAETWSSQEPISLADFLTRFRRYREDEKEEGENPLADINAPAVKVMTIHKAKGLEFPVVILPDLIRKPRAAGFDPPLVETDWRSGRQGIRCPGSLLTNSAMVLNEVDAQKRDAAEEVRVFYVAMTRAKTQLSLVVSDDTSGGIYAGYLSKLGPLPKAGDSLWSVGGLEVPVDNVAVDLKKDFKKVAVSSPSAAGGKTAKMLADLWKSREDSFQKAQSTPLIQSPTNFSAEPEKRWHRDEDSSEALANRDRALQLGELCHKVLEQWDFAVGGELKMAVERAGRMFELSPAVPDDQALLSEAATILEGFLKSEPAAKLKSAKILGRELPFVYSITAKKGKNPSRFMRGVIDLLYEDKRGLVVADYKTTKGQKGKLQDVAKKYSAQSESYREAVTRVFKQPVRFEVIFLRDGESVLLK